MQKDVIYIDVEDDITAIIGKVKDAKEKIVALVPPKRIGVLQSAVNLRLLSRAATQGGKRLVLVTNDNALIALASVAKLPVARNLQSKPELATIPALAIDNDDDIIDGASLPVGELARTAPTAGAAALVDELSADATLEKAVPPSEGEKPPKPKAKTGPKIPNFNKFRKRLVAAILGVIVLVGFLVWAIVFAPHATIVISAKTVSQTVDQKVTLDPNNQTNPGSGVIHSLAKQQKQTLTVDFAPTGKKDVGEKATGTVEFSTDSISNLGVTIPAGTELTSSSGKVFLTNQSVTFTISNYSGASVTVTAASRGASYNAATGDLDGAPSGVDVTFTSPSSGGTDKTVTVVSADDIQKAQTALDAKQDDNAIKQQLTDSLKGSTIIGGSFTVQKGTATASPAQDQEATKATLSEDITYTIIAVPSGDLNAFLDSAMKKQLNGDDTQRVYKNGSDDLSFTQFSMGDKNVATVQLTANGQTGPNIKDDDVKQRSRGKSYGEVQGDIEGIQGVGSVDIKFSPFWVTHVPKDVNKIQVEFELNES